MQGKVVAARPTCVGGTLGDNRGHPALVAPLQVGVSKESHRTEPWTQLFLGTHHPSNPRAKASPPLPFPPLRWGAQILPSSARHPPPKPAP